jgi:hypothetical protein
MKLIRKTGNLMGKRPKHKMPIEQRAKQFAPFQAVAGLDEMLRRAEEEHRRMLESGSEVFVPADEDNIQEN